MFFDTVLCLGFCRSIRVLCNAPVFIVRGSCCVSTIPKITGFFTYFFYWWKIIYVICFNMALPISEQEKQLEYWLNFLQSSLDTSQSKWWVVIVGLREDVKSDQIVNLNYLKINWPNLKFYDEVFQVSSFTRFGILELKRKLGELCESLLDRHAKQIRSSYRVVYDTLQAASLPAVVTLGEVYKKLGEDSNNVTPATIGALGFLHDIGMVLYFRYMDQIFRQIFCYKIAIF